MGSPGHARRASSLAEDSEEIEAGERMCLRGKKGDNHRYCLIRNKMALIVLTRLVFLVLTLSSAGVIITSIWLMLDCRENFALVRPILPDNVHFCTNMGMPALFACCTVLFTIFGLGCTGRRLTGYALIIISSVEILQSVTTLTFYQCNTMSYPEVSQAVNSSLLTCYAPAMSSSPFMLNSPKAHPARSVSRTPSSSPESAFRHPSPKLRHTLTSEKESFVQPLNSHGHLLTSKIRHLKSRTLKRKGGAYRAYQNNFSRRLVFEDNVRSSRKARSHAVRQISERPAECSKNSEYFQHLPSTLKKDELNECVHVCRAYQAICQTSTSNPSVAFKQNSSLRETSSSKDQPAKRAGSRLSDPSANSARDVFENQVKDCGHQILDHVAMLCYYDNQIILPLSMCAPMFYILMSACFIYLAYCDRRLKEYPQTDILIHVPSCPPRKQWTWRNLPCCLGASYQKDSEWKLTSAVNKCWTGMPCCSSYTSTPGATTPEGSASTHELLHLRTLPSHGSLTGHRLDHAVSQTTVNTCLPEDSSTLVDSS